MSDRKKCPLMFPLRDEGPGDCVEQDCAWWHKYRRECCILSGSNVLSLLQKFGIGGKARSRGEGEDKGDF